jgi:probable phosphoglycerate mutase
MSRPPVVILVRHGESRHHVLGLTGGWTDTPLTPLGEQQAQLVAARLERELAGASVRVYTSDLKRAAQTAASIAAALGVAAEPDARLREHNNGDAADLTHDEARERWPDWYGRPLPLDEVIYPGSETARAFFDRCAAFIDDLRDDGRTPVVVSHGGTLNCLVARWLGLSVETLLPIGFEFHTTSITVLREFPHLDPSAPADYALERLNDTSHLTPADGRVVLRNLLRLDVPVDP